jgi:hypothetical protein
MCKHLGPVCGAKIKYKLVIHDLNRASNADLTQNITSNIPIKTGPRIELPSATLLKKKKIKLHKNNQYMILENNT